MIAAKLFPLEKCDGSTHFPLEKCNGCTHFPLEKCKTSLYKGKFYDFFLPGQLVWKRRIVIAYEEREGEG